ncbi:helix-turn-helix domain-containing protein [Huintestinicola sp.]|uniref:PucR family transcriptional regulator n=1 Tax=Huintestinicola sp. TaxID=2981661 RepID=UPI003D7E67D2
MKDKEIYNEYILPLLQYDEKYSGELFHTIDEYIECRENMTAAAKKLFIHRNTMMYRLKQIEEILGVDIDSREALFCIQTGLYIKKIIDTE